MCWAQCGHRNNERANRESITIYGNSVLKEKVCSLSYNLLHTVTGSADRTVSDLVFASH
jgi:hypothetical protein